MFLHKWYIRMDCNNVWPLMCWCNKDFCRLTWLHPALGIYSTYLHNNFSHVLSTQKHHRIPHCISCNNFCTCWENFLNRWWVPNPFGVIFFRIKPFTMTLCFCFCNWDLLHLADFLFAAFCFCCSCFIITSNCSFWVRFCCSCCSLSLATAAALPFAEICLISI